MKRIIAIGYTLFVVFAFLVGYFSNSGPLNYIFVIIASFPWTLLLGLVLGDSLPTTLLVPTIGVAINLSLLWWWSLRKRNANRDRARS